MIYTEIRCARIYDVHGYMMYMNKICTWIHSVQEYMMHTDLQYAWTNDIHGYLYNVHGYTMCTNIRNTRICNVRKYSFLTYSTPILADSWLIRLYRRSAAIYRCAPLLLTSVSRDHIKQCTKSCASLYKISVQYN